MVIIAVAEVAVMETVDHNSRTTTKGIVASVLVVAEVVDEAEVEVDEGEAAVAAMVAAVVVEVEVVVEEDVLVEVGEDEEEEAVIVVGEVEVVGGEAMIGAAPTHLLLHQQRPIAIAITITANHPRNEAAIERITITIIIGNREMT